MPTVQDMVKQVEDENLLNVAARSVADPNKLITGGTVGMTPTNGMIAPTEIRNQAITYNSAVKPAPAPAPTTPAPAPTPAQTSRYFDDATQTWKDGTKPTATPRYDANGNLAGGTKADGTVMSLDEWKASQPQVDEQAIREQVRKEQQARIDSINAAYDEMARQQGVVNAGNLGKTRAVNARSGLLGSDFGDANMSNQEQANANALKAIEAERGQQISAVYTKMDETAWNRIQAEKAQAKNDAEGYADYLSKAQSAANDTIKLMGESGYTVEDLKTKDPNRLQQLLDSTGMSEFELAAKLNTYKPADKQISWKTDIKGNYLIAYGIDPATNEMRYYTQELPQEAVGNDVKIVDGELWSVSPDGKTASKIGGPGQQSDYQWVNGSKYQSPGYFDKTTGKFVITGGGTGGAGSGKTTADSPYASGNSEFDTMVDGIANMESGFNYKAISQPSRNGDKAYGKYQIMGENIPAWTKEVLGQSMTPQQFLDNPEAQEVVARKKLAEYYQKYGTIEDTASMWFSGSPAAGNNASDIYGTSTPAYISNIKGYVSQNVSKYNQPSQASQNSVPEGFLNDIENAVDDLASGKADWGAAWDRIKRAYPSVPDQVIDESLGLKWREPGAWENYKASLKGTSSATPSTGGDVNVEAPY